MFLARFLISLLNNGIASPLATESNMPLRQVTLQWFLQHLKRSVEEFETSYAFFLGAGCSVSSGIPTAGDLVRYAWLPELHRQLVGTAMDIESWATEQTSPSNSGTWWGGPVADCSPQHRVTEIAPD